MIIEKVKEIRVQYDEVIEELSKPEITSDLERYQRLLKEQSRLEKIIVPLNRYEEVWNSAEEARKIIGRQTSEIENILGYRYYDEVIHRDNLVVF